MKAPQTARPRNRTLKTVLLGRLIPALVCVMLVALYLSNRQLRDQVDHAYDRSLAGALRSIDHNISTASGGLAMEQPYLLLEFFQLTASGHVYYRVATEDGLAEIGSPGLPLPHEPLVSGQPRFFYAQYGDETVRIAALARPMDPPLYNDRGGRVIVQVAESLESRTEVLHSALVASVGRDLAVVLISVLVVIWSVFSAVKPLERLKEDLDTRPADDLSPVSASGVPGEVRPLVDAVNLHMARFTDQARVQRQFLDDASHQLRTPLSVLRTQTAYALREEDPAEIRAALLGMQEGLDHAVRTTNQMLSLARAKDATLAEGGAAFEPVDLAELADTVVRALLPAARARRLDLGLDLPESPVEVKGLEWLLREALSNLLDNAIRYTPDGGEITVRVARQAHAACVMVEDSGPGMSQLDIERAGVRFRRGAAGKKKGGAGLGLAIVGTITEIHAAKLLIENRPGRQGLRVALVFTLDLPRFGATHQKNAWS
ncbi:sensor kinase [Bordetella ansorpii]|uniref:histidine kinase n=2 Tax=Bordetella ansorpii TaxID=288768 RepID=A0A157S978_9BORD|nr:sensor kinase [Bordetella ansorpii]